MPRRWGFKRAGRLCLLAAAAATLLIAARSLFPAGYRGLVEGAALKHGLEPSLVWAVIWTESKFRPEAASHAGAVGLMQLTPDTYDWLRRQTGEEEGELTDPAINISYGCRNLAGLLERYESRWAALAAYNAGRARVDGWLSRGLGRSDIPYNETRRFVAQVETVKVIYEILY